MEPGNLSQLFTRIRNIVQLFPCIRNCLIDGTVENRMKYFLFALEIEIDLAVSNASFASDVSYLGIEITVMGKNADGRPDDRGALVTTCRALGIQGSS